MPTLRRNIHPVAKVIDPAGGLVEYVASDETLDSHNEVIAASGWKFDQFRKNSPFVDSHDYSSIDKCLGKVVNFSVIGKQLVTTVKWAIDVPSNILAIRGFQMTAAGYLKAVSVGFMPVVQVNRWDNDSEAWDDAVREVGMAGQGDNIRTIYLEQQLKELSACVIGANPNALAKSYSDGIFTDGDLQRWPSLARNIEEGGRMARRSYIFPATAPHNPQPENSMSKNYSFSDLSPRTRAAMENVELTRRAGNEPQLSQALHTALTAVDREHRHSCGDPAEARLAENPALRFFFSAFTRALGCGHLTPEMRDALAGMHPDLFKRRSFVPGTADPLGSSLLPIDVSREVVDLTLTYGAFRSLGVVRATSQFTKFAAVTGNPTAYILTPSRQGVTTVTQDTALAGASLTPEVNSIVALIGISEELLQDEKADLSLVVYQQFAKALAAALDYSVFRGNGVDDTTNGLTTGLFVDNTVGSAQAAAGNTGVASLQRTDFLEAVGAVTPAALQKNDLHWQIAPGFMPKLLTLKDGASGQYLLKTPAETDGNWLLCGFPVTWNPSAPSVDAAASQVALFGSGQGYAVSMRDELEVMRSRDFQFQNVEWTLRGIMRARGSMRQGNYFSVLKTAPE